MEDIQQLEKKLKEAKIEKENLELNKKLQELKEKHEGKCYGTHSFERKNRSGWSSAAYYEKFWIKDNSIIFLRWSITTQRMGKNYEFAQDQLSFSRQKQEISGDTIIEGNHYLERKEVSLRNFMELWAYGEVALTKFNDAHVKFLDQEPFDILRGGSSNDEKILADAFNFLKLDYVNITENPKVFNALQYKHLPFLQEQKYLPRIYAKQILEYQILKWREEKRIYTWKDDQLDKYIETISNFIQTL